ncbi:lamin tail domain-containing protein [Haloferula sargassicola]|uniref:lamin tail domain-containing protein n=1 Tax=Haloferula sargassicola TaxID=490096 RepID=UPI0033657EBD
MAPFFASLLLPPIASAQGDDLRISEFMASNDTVFPDNADFDDYSDWIELHNAGTSAVALDHYYLTDDLTAPTKWRFPAGASIPAEGYLVVRADGFNAGPGETHLRGYYPWGSTFTTRHFHTSFKLSSGGESVGIFRVDSDPVDETLVARESSWKYRDLGTDPGPDWFTNSYDDSSWSAGEAPLGYNDSWITTTLSYGPSSSSKFASSQFRRHFTVADPTTVSNLRLNLMADDSAVVYLNGAEVARLRMPAGPVDSSAYSHQLAPAEHVYESVELGGFSLLPGDNVIAVEVHQESGTSSDQSFDLELIAELLTSAPVQVDSVDFGSQTSDLSYGRDAGGNWGFFGVPTPGAANTAAPLTVPFATSAAVAADLDSGFYTTAQSVSLDGPAGAVHYTLDGSDPQPGSPVYSAPIAVTATTIVRARVFEDGKIPGPVLTRSYFLDGDASPGLPVFSMVADPETLFGNDIGIYSNDTSYPFKGREVPLRLEFFEQDQTSAFAISAGTKIAGENIWLKPQKPFNIYCRGKYGDDFVPYQLFPGEPSATTAEFSLRNGGDDWEETLLRDAMMAPILRGRMDASLYSYRPSILYLNGDFWGIYNIRKRFDPSYFANEHYLADGDYDLVQYAHDENGVTRLTSDGGSTDRYEALLDFLTSNDPADPAIWSQVEAQVNVDSFIDYVVATDFAVNTSWSHNREFWCGRPEGSKWEWIINDFDRGFDNANITGSLIDNFISDYTLFGRLDHNSGFVDRLIQRYAAHLGSTFFPARFNAEFDQLTADQEPEIARHIARWSSSGGFSASTRQDQIAEIKQFVADRPAYALSRLQLELGISRPMSPMTFAASPAAGGSIRIAGVDMLPAYNDTVSLFDNTPVEITAVPAPGYSFVSWSDGSTEPTLTVTLSGAMSLTANFASGAETVAPLVIDTATTFAAAGSPYVIDGDLIVESGATLTIEAGVEIRMTAGSSILVHGTLDAAGTEAGPIHFVSRDGQPWGNLGFVDTTTVSSLSHVVIRDATVSRIDPLNLKAAVSGFHAELELDHLDIEGPEPVFARFGSTTLLDSRIHITFTGDGINVKKGDAHVERCTFTGNSSVDTDAIDYDGVIDGIIRDNRVYNFRGDNSDGIDVGEGCVNLLVAQNRIYNNSDKGVSVGQGSEVVMRQNLIVGCTLGVGIKDAGSTAIIDQTTFARNGVGVAVYEKNPGAGGGDAVISNCIFSRSKDAPVTVDSLSTVAVTYSLSDTLPIVGVGNFVADPQFTSPGIYDFSLQPTSPAIDAGDPAHVLDPDSTRADLGMAYSYDALDYPFLTPNVVVINEVLSASPGAEPDWIELHNTGSTSIDLGGWYLSDNDADLMKYRIADGTVLSADGYIVFNESDHFGAASTDPGALTPFALSGNGETVYLYKPAEGLDLEYLESEDFGAAEPGVTFGRYYKSSSGTFNFVAMKSPTPGVANSLPKVGPVVISEIMYHPDSNADAEYVELLNISDAPVTLYDAAKGAAWAFTDGIDFTFPTAAPVTLQPGERIIVTRSISAFNAAYGAPAGTQVLQWTSGGLSNSGETLELGMPGELNDLLERQYIRVDRVNYADTDPWPLAADGNGPGLERVNVYDYGNDFANWTAAPASPGAPEVLAGFAQWSADASLPAGLDGPTDDADGDGIANLLEYALGLPPLSGANPPFQSTGVEAGQAFVEFHLPQLRDDLIYAIEQSEQLSGDWSTATGVTLEDTGGGVVLRASVDASGRQLFFRLLVDQR